MKSKPQTPKNSGNVKPDSGRNNNAKNQDGKKDLFALADNFFSKKSKSFFIISFVLTLLFSFLLFDVKVSDGGDDSAYIVRAFDFIHEFKYPGFQGALYPVFLSLFVAVFGINLPLLKALSLIFIACHLILFHRTFRNSAPSIIHYAVLLLISINASFLYFSSQTYSEAFYMFLQGLFFISVNKYFIQESESGIKKFIIVGLLIFLMSLTRSIGYASLIVLIIFFALDRQWKNAAFTVGGFLLFSIPYEILKKIIWGAGDLQFQGQAKVLLFKDPYDPNKGQEDFFGFIERFIDNSNLYLSKHIFIFLGFKPEVTVITPTLTILVYLLFITAFIYIFRKNKLLLFTGLYLTIMLGVTFFILQKTWDQGRLIICYFPLIMLFIFSGLYYAFKTNFLKKFQILVPILLIILIFSSFQELVPKVKEKKEILSKNMSGDMLYGLTPDWINFIKMSKWVAENTPPEKVTASRKPDISFIYTNRKFFPMYKVPTIETDSLFKKIKAGGNIPIAIKLDEISSNNNLLAVHSSIKDNSIAFINGYEVDENDNRKTSYMYGIYLIPEASRELLVKALDEKKLAYDMNIEKLLPSLTGPNRKYLIYDPDGMFNRLKQNNVHYVIMASLRQNPKVNSGQIIDTMNRYLYFIQLKYPSAFKEIHSIGTDESARLIEIVY